MKFKNIINESKISKTTPFKENDILEFDYKMGSNIKKVKGKITKLYPKEYDRIGFELDKEPMIYYYQFKQPTIYGIKNLKINNVIYSKFKN
jgi:hypothetical protein